MSTPAKNRLYGDQTAPGRVRPRPCVIGEVPLRALEKVQGAMILGPVKRQAVSSNAFIVGKATFAGL